MTTIEKLDMNVKQANSDFVAIKNKIVENGVEIANGTRTAEYAEKIDEVYEAGKQAEYDAFWDAFQQNGELTDYDPNNGVFWGKCWNFANFYPKYDIKPVGAAPKLFYAWSYTEENKGNLIDRLNECGVVLDTSQATSLDRAFSYTRITEIPTIDLSKCTNTINVFANSSSYLNKIEKIIVSENTTYANWFYNTNIQEMTVEGTIGQNGFNISYSTRLTKASIESIINALSTTTSGLTITLSKTAVNKAFETSEGTNDGSTSSEWTALIGTKSNWTIALA